MKRRDYPGHDLPRKELHERLMGAYQLAGRLLMSDDPKDIRAEMKIVLLDFLSDPTTATVERLRLASRGFVSVHVKAVSPTSGTTNTATTFEVKSA